MRNHIVSSFEKIVASLKTMTQWDWWTVRLLCIAIFVLKFFKYRNRCTMCVSLYYISLLSKFWLYLFKTLLEAAPWCHCHLRFTNICSSHHTYPSNTSYCLTLRLYDTNSWNPVLFECIQGLLIVSMTAHQTVFNYSFDKNFHSKPVFSILLIVIETIDRSQFYAWHFWIRVYIWVLIGRHRTQMYGMYRLWKLWKQWDCNSD